MNKTIYWKECRIKKQSVKFDGSLRQLGEDIGEDFTYLSKLFNGLTCSEDTARRIITKIKSLSK